MRGSFFVFHKKHKIKQIKCSKRGIMMKIQKLIDTYAQWLKEEIVSHL